MSTLPSLNWSIISSSSNGNNIAVSNNSIIWVSHDSGVSWQLSNTNSFPTGAVITSIESSDTGQILVASLYGDGIYKSVNYGNYSTF